VGIFLYDDRDGVPGFQYTLGALNAFTCSSAAANVDCVMDGSNIRLKEDVFWSIWNIATAPCPAGSGYSSNCSIWTFTTTATLLGNVPVATVTLRLSSQPVLVNPTVNGHEIGPDRAKLDISITYPYTAKGIAANSQAKVGLSAVAAGKAGTFNAVAASIDGNNALVWNGNNDKASFWSYDGTAVVGSVSSTVYVTAISGDSIEKYNCTLGVDCDLISVAIIISLKWVNGIWRAFGWTTELYFFSWNEVRPTQIDYDPSFGMIDSTNSALSGVPPIWSLFLFLFIYLFSK